MTSFRSPKNPKNSIFSRLNYLSKKMSNPKTTAKEMKVLKLREKNLMEMLDEGMEEFKKGGKVTKKKRGGSVRGDGIAVRGKTKGTIR
tara:strand:- start:751 stop:1014 length:264 start_codon:yes stop_codon:yes gene_type:complete